MAAMAAVTAAVEGIANNQPKGAVEEMMAEAMVKLAETTMATETTTVTVAITTPRLTWTTAHQQQQSG